MGDLLNGAVPSDKAVCDWCARCLEVCPTYLATRVETVSARGRMDLLAGVASGELAPTARYREVLSQCVQCLACTAVCPKGVDAAAAVLEERGLRTGTGGRERFRRLLLKAVLADRKTASAIIRILARLQKLLPGKPESGSRHLPLFLPDMLAGRLVPAMADQPIFSAFPSFFPADPGVEPHGTVTFFAGCWHAMVETGPAHALIGVLRANGFGVSIPRDQTCCGAPALFSGHRDIAEAIARKNVKALAGKGPIVTSCATCGSMIRREYPRLLPEDAARRTAERCRDVMELLGELPVVRAGKRAVPATVTIHDPCHLKRGQGVDSAVRRILAAVPELKIAEMEDSDLCCGGGGFYAVSQADLSRRMGENKTRRILETGADAVVTGCPGCILQIRECLARTGRPSPVLHPVELLAVSYGLEPMSLLFGKASSSILPEE